MNKTKRFLGLFLVVFMLLAFVPLQALANTVDEIAPAGSDSQTTEVASATDETQVAMVNGTGYATLAEALEAAKALTGDVTVEIYDKVTLNSAISGSFDSITFVGKDTDAEIYLDVQGYITATGKKVAFEDLTLSKSAGGFITNAGFMNVAFGVYDVVSVDYTNCVFANGAYASSGDVTFTKCTFYRSHDKYGLWAYGDTNAVVDNCVFNDYRGIKMYAEGAAKTTDLTVKNTNFSAVNDKPAIVLTYGESVTLESNTYSSTGTFELDLDGAPNGVAVTSDVAPTCKNDNGACGVLVDGKIYTTVAQAAAVAESGSTVTLLHASTETVELAEGVTLDKNGFEATGVTVAVSEPTGTLTNAYTSASGYWGECGGNAKESFGFKLYYNDTFMGSTFLNNVGGIIDGDVYVSWNIKLDAASNTDEYWTMSWEIAPTIAMQPNRVEQWVDGVCVANVELEPNWSDRIFPVVAAVTDADGKILSYVNNCEGATLADAFANANEGDEVVLLGDITLTEQLVVPKGATVTLDLNGKTISQSKECTASYEMISNKGNLTITGDGKISFTDTSAGDATHGWGSYTIRNEGTLVVENGTIEHNGTQAFATHMICAIFQYSGSTTINGGTISTPSYRSVRLWKGEMTINGGTFDGQVWVQAVDNSANLAVNGGTFEPNGKDASSVFVSNADYDVEFVVTDGTFNGKIGVSDADKLAGAVSGGTFTQTAVNGTNVTLLKEGFTFKENANGTYGVVEEIVYVAQIGDVKFETVADALAYAQAEGITDLVITLIGETTKDSAIALDDAFNLYTLTAFDSVTFKQEDNTVPYYIACLYTGSRTNGGAFVFDGVNIVVTGQYIFEGNVKLINNSVVKSVAEANCFHYYSTTTIEAGSKLLGVIEDFRGGDLIIDGGRDDGEFNVEPSLQDAIMTIRWSGDSLTIKNGAYVKVNSANEVGRTTIEAETSLNVYASKFESYQWIANNGTINTDIYSIITTKKITGAGVINIDITGIAGSVAVINADMSEFTGSINLVGEGAANYEITENGVVVTAAEFVAEVDGVQYATLADAVAALNANGGTLKLLNDVIGSSITVTYTGANAVVIDLNGYAIASDVSTIVVDGATVTLIDSVGTGKVTTSDATGDCEAVTIKNSGSMTMEGGYIGSSKFGVYVYGSGNSFVMNGGTIEVPNGGYAIAANGVSATINGGNVICNKTEGGAGWSLYTWKGATINGGSFTGVAGGSVTIYGGTFTFVEGDYFADGTIATGFVAEENEDGTYSVVENTTPVVTVNGVGYSTIVEALNAAQNGDTIVLLADCALSEVVELRDIAITIEGDYTITLNDNLKVFGETTLNITSVVDGEVWLDNGAILKDSYINGSVFVGGNVTFRGENSVAMLYDFGVLTSDYGTAAEMKWTVEEGASLEIRNKARYGLGYGDSVTIYGSIEDALTARESLTEGDVAFFAHGLVAQESSGWNKDNYFTVKDAYVVIGSNNSFGNKPGSYGGNYSFVFNNVVLDSSRITFYEATSKTELSFTSCDVVTGTFMTRDADSKFTLVNTKLLSTTTTNGTDEGNYNDGALILVNSSLTYSAQLTNNGTITLDINSCLTAPKIIGNGTFVIDVTGLTEAKTVISADMSEFTGEIELVNGNAKCEIVENGVVVSMLLAGSGTESDPYQIASSADLATFAQMVNGGKTFKGEYVKLMNSVDLAPAVVLMSTSVSGNWEPIGTKDNPFMGTFDGSDYTVSNLVIEGTNNVGFFGYVTEAHINNLKIENVTVVGSNCVGAVVGQGYASTYIDNCHVSGNIQITGNTNVGGIVGKYYARVTNSSVIGDGVATSFVKGVYVGADLEGDNVGGIMGHAGENNNHSGNTVMNIKVSGTRKVGGLIGTTDRATDLDNCTVDTVVVESTATADYVAANTATSTIGGLIGNYYGDSTGGTVTNCAVESIKFNLGNALSAGPIVGGNRTTPGEAPTGVTYSGNAIDLSTIQGATNYYLMVVVAEVDGVKYATLQDALNAGGEVVLLTDIVLTEKVTVPKGTSVTLDLAGYTVSREIASAEKSTSVITNYGTLTVKDSSGNNSGKISINYTGASYGYGVGIYAISNEGGTLTIAGGTIENLTPVSGSMYDAIDNNSTLGNTVLNIEGGIISCPSYIGIRQFCNGTANANVVNVSNGVITGGNTSIWMQNPNDNDNSGALNITGGTFNGRLLVGSSDVFAPAVSGGTFSVAVPEEYCADGYIPTLNADGTYGVEKAPTGEVAYRGYINDSTNREAIQIDLANVFARESLVIKLYDKNGNLLTTTTLNKGGVEAESYTCNIVLSGTASGSWTTVINAEKLTVDNAPYIAEVIADGVVTDTYENFFGAGTSVDETAKYLALDCVYKEAKIGGTYYATLQAALDAAQAGETVELLGNVTVTGSGAYIMLTKAITIDGNGYTVSMKQDTAFAYALLYLYAIDGTVTIKDTTFDGITSGAVIWAHDADVVIDNCVFQNGNHTQVQGLVRTTCANLTLTNSEFINNNCNFVITFNYDAAESDKMVVENCTFSGNTVNDTAVIYYVDGASSTITDSSFVGNTVNSASHGAIVYYSNGQNGTVTGNEFIDNTITAAGARATVLALEAGTTATENAFVNNTCTSTASGTTYVGTVLNKADADSAGVVISGNYWNGGEPDAIASKGAPTTIENYYTTYENGVLGGLTAIAVPVAEVNGVKYATLAEALAALQDGQTLTILESITADANMFIELNGKKNVTITAVDGAVINGDVSIGYHVSHVDGVDRSNTTLTVDGLVVNGTLTVCSNDKNLVVENCEAAQITVKTYAENMSITLADNVADGSMGTAANSYGMFIVPNATGYDLILDGNTFKNVQSHAFTIQGCGDGAAVTAANSITVTDNVFESWGLNGKSDRAAFKIWADTKYAPASGSDVNETTNAMRELVNAIEAGNNTFASTAENTVEFDIYDIAADAVEIPDPFYAAEVNGVKYSTLAEAIAAAVEGDVVTLIESVEVTGTIVVDKNITLDLGGKTITNVGGTANHTFRVAANMTVKNGTIDNTEGGYCFIVGYNTPVAGNLTIESGSYYGNTSVVSVTYGSVVINGGYFEATPYNGSYDYTFNCVDRFYTAGNATIAVYGGTFYKFNPENNASEGANTNFCAEGYGAIQNLDGEYVVGEKPTATVNNLGPAVIPEGEWTQLSGGTATGSLPLSFVMQFLADQDAADMATSPYADWYADFVITFTGIENGSFTADGCYLAGYYGDFGWIKVPVDGMTVEEGARYPVMLGYGAGQKYDYICESVKDFRCALFLTPEILAANPNLEVNLELAVVDNSKGSDAALQALVEGTSHNVADIDYVAKDFVIDYVAQIGDKKFASLQDAENAAKDGDTIVLLDDIALTGGVTFYDANGARNITLDLNGKTITIENNYYVFWVCDGLTITGDGEIIANPTYNAAEQITPDNTKWAHTFMVGSNGTAGNLVIENGYFYSNDATVVSVTHGSVTINGGTFEAEGDLDLNCIDSKYNEGKATITVYGGTFVSFNPESNASEGANTNFCADGYGAIKDLDGYYVVGEKPTATVNNLGSAVIPEGDWTQLSGGAATGDLPLSFVMQFLADQDAADMATSPYADWYADFVITFTGIENGSFTADGCYLAGYYGDFGWIKVPVDGMTVEEGARYPVMLGYGAGQKYDYICESVKDFRCALFLTPEILAANPNLEVNLELAVVDNSKGSDAALQAMIEGTSHNVADIDYVAKDFAVVAQVGDKLYASLQEALNAVQAGETITLLADVKEGTIKLPATLQNVTITSAEGVAIINTTIVAADGDSLVYEDITIDGVTFENSGIYIVGWRSGTESYKNWTINNCTFTNLVNGDNNAAVHFNNEANASVDGLTFTNNVVDTMSGSQNAALYGNVTGTVLIENNTIKNTSGNSLSVFASSTSTVYIRNNTLENWGLSGEGRAIRLTGGSAVYIYENTMINDNAPEEFIKITDTASMTISQNYWNGYNPGVEADMYIAKIAPTTFYTDAERTNLVKIAKWTEASLTFGSDLKMNFYLTASSLDSTASYVKIVKTHADGCTGAEEVIYIEVKDWFDATSKDGVALKKIVVEGIAAKEMNCTITAQIFTGAVPTDGAAEGTALSAEVGTSVVDYALYLIREYDGADAAAVKTFAVDMLNYGAAAQEYFHHYEDKHLANADLDEAEKALATPTVDENAVETVVYGKKAYADKVTVEMETSIYLNFYFNNLENLATDYDKSKITAVVSYTDHYDNDVVKTFTAADLVFSEDGGQVKVSVQTLAPADASLPVMCVLYYDQAAITAVSSSISAYCEWGMSEEDVLLNALCEKIMKYSQSAYNYFHTQTISDNT